MIKINSPPEKIKCVICMDDDANTFYCDNTECEEPVCDGCCIETDEGFFCRDECAI